MVIRALTFLASVSLFLGGCEQEETGPISLAFIGDERDLFSERSSLPEPARHLRAATGMGLVALDASGEVIPALADRWIVTDDGTSYIFRLRDARWPNGERLSAENAEAALKAAVAELRETPLGLELDKISEIRAMAGRVVEIRLKSPMPDFLQLLAQPELALAHGEDAIGPMSVEQTEGWALLEPNPPEARGLPVEKNWREGIRPIAARAISAPEAIALFDQGRLDIVLGGRIDSIPLVDTGPLSRGTVRLDPALGLFGLQVRRDEGVLATPAGREAVAMALNRSALLEPYAVGGWNPSNRIVTAGVTDDFGAIEERWQNLTIEQRRAEAARRVAAWVAEGDPADEAPREPRITVALGQGPGLDILFEGLRRQLATVGIALERVDEDEADLVLLDRTARYAGARWFLDQFNCLMVSGPCAPEADILVEQSLAASDAANRAILLAQAEAELAAANVFIPIAQPLRWSLIRGNITGFVPNAWAFHPLPDIAGIPR